MSRYFNYFCSIIEHKHHFCPYRGHKETALVVLFSEVVSHPQIPTRSIIIVMIHQVFCLKLGKWALGNHDVDLFLVRISINLLHSLEALTRVFFGIFIEKKLEQCQCWWIFLFKKYPELFLKYWYSLLCCSPPQPPTQRF